MTRLGEVERLIIVNLSKYEVPKGAFTRMRRENAKYRRHFWAGMVPILDIRNHIYGIETIGASERASFSRAVKSLEKKGLVQTSNDISSNPRYRTHIKLTKTGQEHVNNSGKAEMLTLTGGRTE